MAVLTIAHFRGNGYPISFTHSENRETKRLLDVLFLLLAEEYIQTAKENPEIFLKDMIKQNKKTAKPQKSAIYTHPMQALAGLIKCKCCNGAIVQVSNKGGGHYACYNATMKDCINDLTISKKEIEAMILNDLREQFITTESLKYIYKKSPYYVAHTSIQNLALLDIE